MQSAATARALDHKIVRTISRKPAWMPEIAKHSGTTMIKTRNVVARLFDEGVINITRQGFVAVSPR